MKNVLLLLRSVLETIEKAGKLLIKSAQQPSTEDLEENIRAAVKSEAKEIKDVVRSEAEGIKGVVRSEARALRDVLQEQRQEFEGHT